MTYKTCRNNYSEHGHVALEEYQAGGKLYVDK